MFEKFKVKVPVSGRITVRKLKPGQEGKSIYVEYARDRVYNPKTKHMIPKKTTIGKLCPDDSSLMFPNTNFFTYFPDYEIVGAEEEVKENSRSSCLNAGAFLVMRKIIRESGVDKMVDDLFGDNAGFLLDLAMYCIVTEDNAAQYFPDYAYSHPLLTRDMRIHSDEDICGFLKSISHDDCSQFLNDWNDRNDKENRIYLAYDSTNKHCQAGDVIIAEPGHAKDGIEKPIINYSIAYDLKNREPMFYEDYFGSVPDVAELQYLIDRCTAYGYKNLAFIIDRGYFSKDNLHYLRRKGYHYIIMMKGRKELARGVIDEVKHKFENKRANEVKRFHTNSITVKRKLFVNDEDEVWIHVYYKAGKFAAEKEEMDTDLDEAKKALDRHLQKEFRPTSFIQQYYDLYYSKDEEGKEVLTAYAEKTEAIDKERDYLGYYMIVTSEEMTAGEALTLYKSRDAQEKLFRGDKSFTSGKAYRVHSEGSLEAKIFIEFIAMIIRNRIYLSLLDEEERNGTDLNYMNVTAALRQLEKIQMVRERRSQYHLDSALTKIQKTILKAFGLNQGNIKDLIRELNKRIPEVSGLIPITM